MKDIFSRCFTMRVIIRSACISLVVGTLLVVVNYGSIIEKGTFSQEMWFPVFLNYLIPFSVSKIASGFK